MVQYFALKGLTPGQVLVVVSTISAAAVCADVPLGYLADRYGGKRVIYLTSAVQIAYGLYLPTCQKFIEFEIAMVLNGLWLAAQSNLTSTIMTQMLDTHELVSYESRIIQARSAGLATGTAAGGMMVAYRDGDISLPFQVQPAVYLLALLVVPWIVEIKKTNIYSTTIHTSAFKEISGALQDMRKTIRTMLIDRRDIRYLAGLTTSIQVGAFLCFWMLQPLMVRAGIDEKLFAPIYLARTVLVLVCSSLTRVIRKMGDLPVWICLVVVLPVGIVVVTFNDGYPGIAALLLAHVFISSLIVPMIKTYLCRTLSDDRVSSTRTTELSVMSTISSMSYAVLGIVCGKVMGDFSLIATLLGAAAVSFVPSCIALAMFQKNVR